jgi:hypothetical protein
MSWIRRKAAVNGLIFLASEKTNLPETAQLRFFQAKGPEERSTSGEGRALPFAWSRGARLQAYRDFWRQHPDVAPILTILST